MDSRAISLDTNVCLVNGEASEFTNRLPIFATTKTGNIQWMDSYVLCLDTNVCLVNGEVSEFTKGLPISATAKKGKHSADGQPCNLPGHQCWPRKRRSLRVHQPTTDFHKGEKG